MAPRIKTSEPTYRAPLSQSQRDRMGCVHPTKRAYYWPLEAHSFVDEHGCAWTVSRVIKEAALVAAFAAAFVVAWLVLA